MIVPSLMLIFGLAAGALIVWLILRERLAAFKQRLGGADDARIRLETDRKSLTDENKILNDKVSHLEMLGTAEVRFENLANKIFEDQRGKLTEQSQSSISSLLGPFSQDISNFKATVDKSIKEGIAQHASLENELKNLKGLNQQLSQDAIDLTNALKGQTKTQGAWGEIILERVLEMSGLVKGREYEIQVTLTSEEGKRSCPDVIVYLPEKRHLVIDSKVNLVAYERYCTLSDGPERDAELKRNISAFRKHIGELDLKRYQDHYKLNSLDFVLMFVPIEGAFIVAVQNDPNLFDQAFEKNLVIVSPSTLLATMRTIHNLWRQEYQSRNALKIAIQAGRLYDKFALFFEDLQDIGSKLNSAHESYESAHNKLVSGRGNILSRIANMKLLGARAKKSLPQDLVDDAMEDDSDIAPSTSPDVSQSVTEETQQKDSMPLLNSMRATGE